MCSNGPGDSHTLHSPPDATPSARRPCFDAPAIRKVDERAKKAAWGDGNYWLRHPCWNRAGYSWDEESIARVRGCLTPDRGADGTQQALFFIGDSHAGAMLPGVEASVRGVMALAYSGRGMCAYLSDEDIRLGRCAKD